MNLFFYDFTMKRETLYMGWTLPNFVELMISLFET